MGRRSFTKHEQQNKEKKLDSVITLPRSWDYVERFTQPFLYPFETFETITIKQSELGDIKINATLWDTAIVMSKFFEIVIGKDGLKNKRIIELGGGVGLTGIVLSKMGANIIITEQKSMHSILEYNVRENITDFSKTKVAELWWGDDIAHEFNAPFDLIIGSDLIYEDHCIDLLLKSLLDLSSIHPKPKSKYSDIIEQIDSNNGEIPPELIEKLKNQKIDNEDDEDNDQDEKDDKEDNKTTTTTTTTTTTSADNTNNNDKPKDKKKKKKSIKKKKEDDEEPKGEDYLYASALLEPAPNSVIYLGYENRQMSAESIFFERVHNYFEVEEILTTHLNPGFTNVDIRILKMKKKLQTMEKLLSYNKK